LGSREDAVVTDFGGAGGGRDRCLAGCVIQPYDTC
jgi:hypothetical protein